ncbi:neurotrypsin-like [Dreissena polymorpha]|uniref:SRCR domain-containing protein n=1 Tax=Dreissena polymorpha TaxID=45954 RepID=A0A9D4F370_DREPO|nr:neurotrypsin-like [Dreissena polymorpha]KAH3791530.1 hypothetical protein DPMN_145018 [Dreissena polymorpha]
MQAAMVNVFLLPLLLFKVVFSTQLVDGPTPLQGRVEVELFGQIQSICSLGIDSRAANVICASLGYRGATQLYRDSNFGSGQRLIYNHHIACLGNETSLDMCQHSSIQTLGCDYSNVVGVECQGDTIKIEPLFNSRPYEGTIKGIHGDIEYDIRGHIDTVTAQTMCAMLGYGRVGFAVREPFGLSDAYNKERIMCQGWETSISECRGATPLRNCSHVYHRHMISAGPMGPSLCERPDLDKQALFCSDYTLQGLRIGPDGILLMKINGRHWAVCVYYTLTTVTANAACKIMGYDGGEFLPPGKSGPNDVEIIGSLICDDYAESLHDCHMRSPFNENLRPYNNVSAICEGWYVRIKCHNGTDMVRGPQLLG